MTGKHDGVIRIERPVNWLDDHTHVLVHGTRRRIRTANRFGDVKLASGHEVNIEDSYVELL